MNMSMLRGSILGGCFLWSTFAYADAFHYNNVIIGERAQGLGGAYTAVSDDASGVFYNPAGLAFAQSNDISGSANAFYSKKIVYKNVFDGQDFTETSGGTFAPFFGVMQKLDRFLPGLVAGFAYYTLDTELTDQNDVIKNGVVSSTLTYNTLRRTLNRRSASIGASAGVGYRLTPNLSLGFTLSYLNTDDLLQSYLMIDQTSTATGTGVRSILSQNVRQKVTLYGLEPVFGIQWAPLTKLAWGLSIRKGQYASQRFEQQTHIMNLGSQTESPIEATSKNPVGNPPLQVRTGLAYFASPRLLVTTDVMYFGAVEDMESEYKAVNKKSAVTNYAVGSEFYVTPSIPLRLGVFTNSDTRSEVNSSQIEKIDYTGASIFAAWAQPNSQISLGTVVQQGSGESQKVGPSSTQKVDAFAYTIGFSATHSF